VIAGLRTSCWLFDIGGRHLGFQGILKFASGTSRGANATDPEIQAFWVSRGERRAYAARRAPNIDLAVRISWKRRGLDGGGRAGPGFPSPPMGPLVGRLAVI